MAPLRCRDESPGTTLEDVLNLYPWYKNVSSRPPDSKKNKGSLLLGKPSKYSFLAKGFAQQDQNVPARRPSPKTPPKAPPKSFTSPARCPLSKTPSKTVNSGGKAATTGATDVDSKSDHKAAAKSWLHQQVKDFFDTPKKQRLGELPTALVKAIWGTKKETAADKESSDAATDDLIRKLTKLKKKDESPAECLMDVLLQSWTYFSHSHSKSKSPGSHVHAKYCENMFDHFLLPDGTQVHGSYVIPLQKLITELRALTNRLKSRVIHTDFKALPTWKPPVLEEATEFALPTCKEVPPLYPIEGLLDPPTEEVPANKTTTVFSPPTPKRHPPFIVPALIKAPQLSLPTMRDFSVERKSIDYSIEQDLPLPTFYPPEPLPLPVWQEPAQETLPAEPQLKEIEVLPPPILQPLPPYLPPDLQPRPCEASYYPVPDAVSSVCDGLCGNTRNPLKAKTGKCRARPPVETSAVVLPPPPKVHIHEEPLFQPPAEEAVPEFKPPTLKTEPKYDAPSKPDFPDWRNPPPPDPVGYLAGKRPVFLIECSTTMAGERFKVAQEAIRYLFSGGGQVDVAATHFDVIMYSFEAWSFGALEEERQYKLSGVPIRHWLKNLEVMQPKTPAKVEKCLTWISKWQTGGRSNLLNALQVAFQRENADCIYLFTDGKPERPVILMNMLKKMEKERGGKLVPVYPIGIGTSKRGSWFMQKIAETTGGKFQELDFQWRSKAAEREGTALQDTSLAQKMVAEEQHRNLEAGTSLDIEAILEKLKRKYEEEKSGPSYTEYLEKERKAKESHRRASEVIIKDNARALADAQKLHAELTASIEEKNKERNEHAWKRWVEELQKVRDLNSQQKKVKDDWERLVTEKNEATAKTIADAKKAFVNHVKKIKEENARQQQQSMKLYEAEVKHIKENNLKLGRDTQRRQAEIVAETEAQNNELKRQYEEQYSEIRARNSSVLEKARSEYSAACAAINNENQRALQEAQEEFERVCEEVKAANCRRQNDYNAKLAELDERMKSALVVHQEQVSAIVAEHDSDLVKVSLRNSTLEEDAKREWEEKCKRIDGENQRAFDKSVSHWEAACRAIQEENERLEKRRLELLKRAAEIDHLNQELVQKKKQEWNETCNRLELEYQREVELARKEHEEHFREVQLRNEEALDAAKLAHKAQVATVEAYNETIRPFVESSKLVQKEIDRINLFLHHIVDKLEMPSFKKSLTSRKPTIEQRLDLLSNKEHPCHPKIICEALKAAYDEDLQSGTFPKKPPASTRVKPSDETPSKQRSRFEGMLPVSPIRVVGHHCDLNNQRKGRDRSLSATEFLKKTVNRQHEIAVMIAPMTQPLSDLINIPIFSRNEASRPAGSLSLSLC
ncbi:hypothetical protein R1sor_020710 [Riccia sorocarpa]|uniref:VWFA domain-containing protein n=1 Tax=Riccia sorocarpa TaxID=122646 RepID=A0ABD3GJ72_9MARC